MGTQARRTKVSDLCIHPNVLETAQRLTFPTQPQRSRPFCEKYMNPICTRCGQPSATIQTDLFNGPTLCLGCLTIDRIKMLLQCLPIEEDDEWEQLTEWEQGFLPSVREQFARKGTLSENQVQRLEIIWKKQK